MKAIALDEIERHKFPTISDKDENVRRFQSAWNDALDSLVRSAETIERVNTDKIAITILKKRLKHLLQSEYIRKFDEKDPRTGAYMLDIRRATGAEPQPHARWVKFGGAGSEYSDRWQCDRCKQTARTESWGKVCEYERCPHCGAIMDGGAENGR